MIDGYLAQATIGEGEPSILIAPHAGYVYSGPVAAFTFKALAGRACDGVIVLGFNHAHSYEFDGASIWLDGAWRTPLGDAPIDSALAQSIRAPGTVLHQAGRAHDRALVEVMLPFLQRVLPGQSFVPISIGRRRSTARRWPQAGRAIEQAHLRRRLGDLSHYPPYEGAVTVDRETVAAVLSLDLLAQRSSRTCTAPACPTSTRACGQGPIFDDAGAPYRRGRS
jgi:AmmeMemoRadiSam system protein B